MDTIYEIFESVKGAFSFLLSLIQKNPKYQQTIIRDQKVNFKNSNSNTVNFNNNINLMSEKKKPLRSSRNG